MRTNFFSENIMQPGDTDPYEAWPDFDTENAVVRLYDVPDDKFLYGGEVSDAECNTYTFDGFDSVDQMRTFVVQVLKISTADIEVLSG